MITYQETHLYRILQNVYDAEALHSNYGNT